MKFIELTLRSGSKCCVNTGLITHFFLNAQGESTVCFDDEGNYLVVSEPYERLKEIIFNLYP